VRQKLEVDRYICLLVLSIGWGVELGRIHREAAVWLRSMITEQH